MAMELAVFFSAPEEALKALEALRRSGHNVATATITNGGRARESFDRCIASERWGRALSGALVAVAVSLIFSAFLIPPAPAGTPWAALGAFALASGLLGGAVGRFYGYDAEANAVLLELMVPKDHVNGAVHLLRNANGRFVTFRAASNRVLQRTADPSARNEPQTAID